MNVKIKQIAQAAATNFQRLAQDAAGAVIPRDQILSVLESYDPGSFQTNATTWEMILLDSSFGLSYVGYCLVVASAMIKTTKSTGYCEFIVGRKDYASGNFYTGNNPSGWTTPLIRAYGDVWNPVCSLGLVYIEWGDNPAVAYRVGSGSGGGTKADAAMPYLLTIPLGQRATY